MISDSPPSTYSTEMSQSSPPPEVEQTEVGSYFVANYPPFSVWNADAVSKDARPALASPPVPGVSLGVYLHIPFCRKRCHFCYFRVYTDKNARQVEKYLHWLAAEWELVHARPAVAGRPLNFIYFGGGTPSFLSTHQLDTLVTRVSATAPWSTAEEITFECEPGTLTEAKLAVIRSLGVTRLSLGVENFDDRLLELNGRAHRSPEIARSYQFARSIGFPQNGQVGRPASSTCSARFTKARAAPGSIRTRNTSSGSGSVSSSSSWSGLTTAASV